MYRRKKNIHHEEKVADAVKAEQKVKKTRLHTGGSRSVFLIRLELSPKRLHFVTPDYFSPQGQNQSAELKEANKLKVIRMALHIICHFHAFSWTLNKPKRKNGAIRLHSLLLTRTRASYLNHKVLACRFTQLDTPPSQGFLMQSAV